MQKDTIVETISSVELNEEKKNKAVTLKNIGKTIIYDKEGNELQVINNGYLDIGLNDTMKDLFVNFIGAVVFSLIAYISLKKNKENKFINKFVPTKEKRQIAKVVEENLSK